MLIRNQVLVKIRISINSTKLKYTLLHAVIGFKETLRNPWMLTRHCPGCLNHLRPRHTKIGSRPRPIDRGHIKNRGFTMSRKAQAMQKKHTPPQLVARSKKLTTTPFVSTTRTSLIF